MVKSEKFMHLEHRADAYIAAYGDTLEEAFENAALAMFETMTETSTVKPKIQELVSVTGSDEESLLYNWLEELLVRFDVSQNLYSRFEIKSIEKLNESLSLQAIVRGEKFNPEKHPQKVGVKAITYHQMKIDKTPSNFMVEFILDI